MAQDAVPKDEISLNVPDGELVRWSSLFPQQVIMPLLLLPQLNSFPLDKDLKVSVIEEVSVSPDVSLPQHSTMLLSLIAHTLTPLVVIAIALSTAVP